MLRNYIFLCSGVCLLNATVSSAQVLPKNPTIKQMVGYQLLQQQKWNMRQLPPNSVLYKYNFTNPALQRNEFLIRNEIRPSFKLILQSTTTSYPRQDTFFQNYLLKERKQFSQWLRKSWWKYPEQESASEILKSIMTGNRRAF